MKHVVVIVPVDAQVDEAQNVAQEDGNQRRESLGTRAVRHFQLQHHDGDEDGDHAITERFESILSHGESSLT